MEYRLNIAKNVIATEYNFIIISFLKILPCC